MIGNMTAEQENAFTTIDVAENQAFMNQAYFACFKRCNVAALPVI